MYGDQENGADPDCIDGIQISGTTAELQSRREIPISVFRRPQRENSHCWRHPEAHRENAGSDPGGDKEVTAAFNDVTSGEALTESRWDDQRPCEWGAYLAAMRMASQRQGDSVPERGRRRDYASTRALACHRRRLPPARRTDHAGRSTGR